MKINISKIEYDRLHGVAVFSHVEAEPIQQAILPWSQTA